MKPSTRGTLAAIVTGVAAAVGAAATPAAAIGAVPVPVPLDGVEKSLNVELPTVGGELPVPAPGALEGPR
ncbi:energy-converting hydrogenase Eha subunit E [Streptomyces sp. V3I7]|nr:energy-converting hydrogenase Eha subunit E [Streptomyces sp. V3I7]